MDLKNGILINGEMHELIVVPYYDCKDCSLKKVCHKHLTFDRLCDIFEIPGINYRFINRGELEVKLKNRKD